ncbi:MAG: DUF3466 family protein [Colwellia sp.]
MKSFAKNILALSLTSALSLSIGLINHSYAATYKVIDKNAAENLGYTYGGKLNNQGSMAISGSNYYNFPIQFEYFDDEDFASIVYLAYSQQNYYYGLGPIEDTNALRDGDPTANDLAWSKLYLESVNETVENFEYQIVADNTAMINLGEGTLSTEICIFDTNFDGTACTGELTRSTSNVIAGLNNAGTLFGSGTAPYLPIDGTDESDIETHWVREHGQRGFYSLDLGVTIEEITPTYSEYGGGISAILDINDSGTAIGYTSYAVNESSEADILDEENGGCADPTTLASIPYEVCVQKMQGSMYYIQAFKASLSDTNPELELLGLLVEPHEDDTRDFSSQALAINNTGYAVGYAQGWDENDLTEPTSNQSMTGSYAVMFKEDRVLDFNQEHYLFSSGSVYSFSQANDINDNGLVVGYTHETTTFVQQFFYVDTNVSDREMEIVIPEGFFNSSASEAFAVNSDGVIVGKAQIESHNESSSNPRRTTGFMYKSGGNSPEIIDLNTLLTCDTEYDIIIANDINDVGQISATAIVQSAAFDALGEPILDISGNPEMVGVVRAVLLEPIEGGEVENCDSTEEKVEREGASFGGFILLSLMALVGLRRKKA